MSNVYKKREVEMSKKNIWVDLGEFCRDYKLCESCVGLNNSPRTCWFCIHWVVSREECEIPFHNKYRRKIEAQRHPNQTKIEVFV